MDRNTKSLAQEIASTRRIVSRTHMSCWRVSLATTIPPPTSSNRIDAVFIGLVKGRDPRGAIALRDPSLRAGAKFGVVGIFLC